MFIIDRFEGDYAILEDSHKQMCNVKRELLPVNAKEGDCLKQTEQGYVIDTEATHTRKAHIRNLMNSLFED